MIKITQLVDQIELGQNPPQGIAGETSIGTILSNALKILFIAGGIAVLVFIVWGAFDWITSGGDKEKVAGAQKKITNSLIGLALLALSAFIVSLAGQIVGLDPTKMGILPTLGQQAP